MKKLIAVILSLMLIVSCLPLTATAAKDTSIEQKFRLLLDDMEIAYAYHQPGSYYYEELTRADTWTLICGGMNDLNPSNQAHTMHYATAGNKLIASNTVSEPFKSGFGVFDSRSGAFYDLTDAWERDFPGLHDAWNNLPSSEWVSGECSAALIGDADGDGKVNILDATRIQRIIAKLDADNTAKPAKEDFFYGWPIAGVGDYDRDGKLTVLDATSIQRRLVSLPKVLEFNTLCCCPTDAYSASPAEPSTARILRTSAEEFDFTNRYGDNSYDLTLFHDDPTFREKSVLVGAFVLLPDENDRVKSIDRVSLGADGMLTVDLTYGKGSGESGGWMILLGITRAFADDIRDVKVNLAIEESPLDTAVIASIAGTRPLAPDDLNADGYRALATEPLGISYPESYPSYEYPYPDTLQEPVYVGNGYLMLLRSRSDLEYYLPETDTEGKLDDAFFGEYAVLAALMLNDRAYSSAQLSDVAVHNGTTLYADPWIKSNNQSAFHDDDMMYDLVDEVLLVLTKVKQSDVKDVDTLACWKKAEPTDTSMTASVVNAFRMIDRPAHPQNEGYTPILSANSYGGEYYTAGGDFPAIFTEMVDDDTEDGGVLAVVRSAEALPKFFSNPSMIEKYDDAYFEDNALVILVLMLDGYDYGFGISHICVKDGVLYAEYDVTDAGVYEPMYDVYYAVSEVRQSDVADVKQTALWNNEAHSRDYLYNGEAYDKLNPAPDYDAEGYVRIPGSLVRVTQPAKLSESSLPLMYWNLRNYAVHVCVVNNRTQFDFLFPGFDPEHTLTDNDFDTYSYVVAFASDMSVEIADVYSNGLILGAELSLGHLDSNSGVGVDIRRIKKSDLTISLALWQSADQPASFTVEMPAYDSIDAYIPDDPARSGWNILDAEELPMDSVDDPYCMNWEDLYLNETSTGYVALLQSRDDLHRLLPGFDPDGVYDDAFFDEYSIVAMLGQGYDDGAYAVLSDLAVHDSILALCPRVAYEQHYDDEGEPVAEPTAPIVVSFKKLKKSDVAGVKSFRFWKPHAIVNYDNIPFEVTENYLYQPWDGNLSFQNAGYLISYSYQVKSTMTALYTGESGDPIDRDDHIFEIERSGFNFIANSVIALRYYQGGGNADFAIKKVYRRDSGTLVVEIERNTNVVQSPDNAWRIIFLTLPRLDKSTYKVEVTTPDKSLEKDGFEYARIDENKSIKITGYHGTNKSIMIPEKIEDLPVTVIGSEAFADNEVIETVYMGENINYIGSYAFARCSALRSVDLSLTPITTIEEGTFEGCENLQYCYINNRLQTIGNSAFRGCKSLKDAPIGEKMMQIFRDAFKGCDSIPFVYLPKSIQTIASNSLGYRENNDKIEGFTVYGYRGTNAEAYAVDNGFAFVALDGTGDLRYDVIDCRYPSADMRFLKDLVSIYVTSPDELAAALDTLYLDVEGVSRRADDPAAYAAEALDEEWFRTHDLIAVRIEKNRGYSIWINGIIADVGNKILVSLIHDYNGSDPDFEIDPNLDNDLCFLMLGIDKRDLTEGDPEITVNVGYYPEPLKPIIYLYPEQEIELTVTLGKPEELTCTYPAYNNGWHITAKPDGTLIGDSGRSYYALYWESKSKTPVSMPDGFVVRGEDTASFLEEKLAILGLSEREAQEFIIYWLPQMQDNEYNLIRFATADEIERIMPLSFSVQPDTVIRVLMEYKPLEEYIEVPEQILTTPERRGFVAVEWGGTLIGQ